MPIFGRKKKQETQNPVAGADDTVAKPSQGDFSHINSPEKAQAAFESGELTRILLMAERFGGAADPVNSVFVPHGVEKAKEALDGQIEQLLRGDLITSIQSSIDYHEDSFIPTRLVFDCSHVEKGGSFTPTLEIWTPPSG